MLKVFRNTEKKSTIAVIEKCDMDAVAKIGRVIANSNNIRLKKTGNRRIEAIKFACKHVPNIKEAVMSDTIKGTVTCDPRDEYNEAVGESEAVKKAMRNHNEAFKSALMRWQIKMIKDVIAVSPKTFKQALHEATND